LRPKGEGTISFSKVRQQWVVRVPCGRLPNGNTKYLSRYAKTKSEANRIHRQLLNSRDELRLRAVEPMTFQEFAELHLSGEAVGQIRASTLQGYQYLLRRHAYPTLGSRQLRLIDSSQITELLVSTRKTISASRTNHLRAALSRIFEAACNHWLIEQNPVHRTKRMKTLVGDRSVLSEPWTLDDCKAALDAAKGLYPMDLFLHLAILTGARLGEMLGLAWDDVDLTARTVTIRRSLVELRGPRSRDGAKGQPEFCPPKTPRSTRTLSLSQPLVEALVRHKSTQETIQRASGGDWKDSGCIFTTSAGNPVWPSNFSAKYRRFLRANNLRHANIHSIRHSFAINSLSLGIDLPSISRALGHASLQITLDIYAREMTNLQDKATQGLGSWFAN